MSDPRLPAATRAITAVSSMSEEIAEAIAAAVLETLPVTKPGDLVILRVADEIGEADVAFAQAFAVQLAQHGAQLVCLADADLAIAPDAEQAWRAAWSNQAAVLLDQLGASLEEEAGRHRNAYERNAWAGAAEKIRESAPLFFFDLAEEETDTTPQV